MSDHLWSEALEVPPSVDLAPGVNPTNFRRTSLAQELFPAGALSVTNTTGLPNLLRVSDQIYSGGLPTGEAGWNVLVQLGVRTVVSVDGAQPNVEAARRHGLRYVHIPIGYDGISDWAGRSLTRLMREAEGPFYIHCHHGRHRGPAGAAVACIAAGIVQGPGAAEILRRGGTSPDYMGLWRDVETFVPPGPDVVLPQLVEIAEVDTLARAMVRLDQAFDNLLRCQQSGWNAPPDHPDLVPSQEALMLKEGLREATREKPKQFDARFLTWMQASEALAETLESSLRAGFHNRAISTLKEIQESCTRCHQTYRN